MAGTFDDNLEPLKFEQLTSLGSATPLTLPDGAVFVLLQAETESVRWRDDGTAPTATVGHILTAGDPPFFYSGRPGTLQFIEAAAGAVLNVTYYRAG